MAALGRPLAWSSSAVCFTFLNRVQHPHTPHTPPATAQPLLFSQRTYPPPMAAPLCLASAAAALQRPSSSRSRRASRSSPQRQPCRCSAAQTATVTRTQPGGLLKTSESAADLVLQYNKVRPRRERAGICVGTRCLGRSSCPPCTLPAQLGLSGVRGSGGRRGRGQDGQRGPRGPTDQAPAARLAALSQPAPLGRCALQQHAVSAWRQPASLPSPAQPQPRPSTPPSCTPPPTARRRRRPPCRTWRSAWGGATWTTPLSTTLTAPSTSTTSPRPSSWGPSRATRWTWTRWPPRASASSSTSSRWALPHGGRLGCWGALLGGCVGGRQALAAQPAGLRGACCLQPAEHVWCCTCTPLLSISPQPAPPPAPSLQTK